ncbi:hypothetical protein Zmor_011178 [Zophobas morio]|uniref:Uncharacterized protein n=1 Tax=Zophobas morio TaxID=2755281 RepID=A0AA38IQJ3_9CUCU|nr:hypothetical protein Zmor_011178 [Zophobas morio]
MYSWVARYLPNPECSGFALAVACCVGIFGRRWSIRHSPSKWPVFTELLLHVWTRLYTSSRYALLQRHSVILENTSGTTVSCFAL